MVSHLFVLCIKIKLRLYFSFEHFVNMCLCNLVLFFCSYFLQCAYNTSAYSLPEKFRFNFSCKSTETWKIAVTYLLYPDASLPKDSVRISAGTRNEYRLEVLNLEKNYLLTPLLHSKLLIYKEKKEKYK